MAVNALAHICVIKEVDTSSASLFEGAVNATVGNLGQVCNNAVAFNVIIDIPTNLLEPMESVMIYLPTAVVAEYSLILPGKENIRSDLGYSPKSFRGSDTIPLRKSVL